jgi:hypothetical protein
VLEILIFEKYIRRMSIERDDTHGLVCVKKVMPVVDYIG